MLNWQVLGEEGKGECEKMSYSCCNIKGQQNKKILMTVISPLLKAKEDEIFVKTAVYVFSKKSNKIIIVIVRLRLKQEVEDGVKAAKL